MSFITQTLVTAFALVLVAYILPGITITGLAPLLFAAIVLGLLNAVVRPILVVLTLPITILTLGLFLLVINATLLYGASLFVEGFSVQNFATAMIGSLLVTIISAITGRLA